MKTFIVFLAFCLVFVSMLVYTTDMHNYTDLQNQLKAIAEECAGGGALELDPESYAKGEISIDEDAAFDYSQLIIQNVKIANSPLSNGRLDVSVALVSPSAIKATVTYDANEGYDIFRLPFLSARHAERSAVYEWK